MDLKKHKQKVKIKKNCDSCDLIFGFNNKERYKCDVLETFFLKKLFCVSNLAYFILELVSKI